MRGRAAPALSSKLTIIRRPVAEGLVFLRILEGLQLMARVMLEQVRHGQGVNVQDHERWLLKVISKEVAR